MNPLKRNNPGVRATDHENRISVLERRHAVDYPLWGGDSMGDITVENADTYEFGWTFPGPDPCELPDCDPDDWHNIGDYLVLPLGYTGMFKVYMTAACSGGCAEFENYREVVDPGDLDQHGKAWLRYETEVWREGEPFGTSSLKGFMSWGEHPPAPETIPGLYQRFWWYHDIHAGVVNMNPETDQWALKPTFILTETLGGPANITGLTFAVELMPGTQQVPAFSG